MKPITRLICKAIAFPFGLIAYGLLLMLNGVSFMYLWKWFMVPNLGLPLLPLTQCIGITLLISLCVTQHIPRTEKDKYKMIGFAIFTPPFLLVSGWVVHMINVLW